MKIILNLKYIFADIIIWNGCQFFPCFGCILFGGRSCKQVPFVLHQLECAKYVNHQFRSDMSYLIHLSSFPLLIEDWLFHALFFLLFFFTTTRVLCQRILAFIAYWGYCRLSVLWYDIFCMQIITIFFGNNACLLRIYQSLNKLFFSLLMLPDCSDFILFGSWSYSLGYNVRGMKKN